ncbi:MAG: hypothetical protein U9R21_02645 [Candidatus Thermoplasmatota archaeon]|nr:hypothetical protein [Candidatus Thermoplasmatota archaeon]
MQVKMCCVGEKPPSRVCKANAYLRGFKTLLSIIFSENVLILKRIVHRGKCIV